MDELASPVLYTLFDLLHVKTQCWNFQMFVIIFIEEPNTTDTRKMSVVQLNALMRYFVLFFYTQQHFTMSKFTRYQQ